MRAHFACRGLLAAALLTSGTFACKGDPNTPEYWTKALTEKKTREQAIKDIRKDKTAVQIDGLIAVSKEEGTHRPDIAQLLGQMGEKFPEHKDKVAGALKDMVDYGVGGASDKASRAKNLTNQRVAEALGRMEWTAGEEVVTRLLDSKDNNTRLAAVTALGRMKSKAAVDKLVTIVNEDDNNFMVKNAIIALGDIGDEKAVPALVRMMFFERGVSFYREASYALFQIGKPAVPALNSVLAGKEDHLKNLPAKPDPWIAKAKAIEVLADIGDVKAGDAALSVLTNPGDGSAMHIIAVQKAAAAAGRLQVAKAAPTLRKLGTNIDVTQAELPLEALTLIGDRTSGSELIKLADKGAYMSECKKDYDEESCKNSELEVRQLRLEAGTRLAAASELDALEKMEAAEKDAKLKEMIGKEKARLVAAKECGEDAKCWIGKLKDTNPKVRDKAAYELAWMKKAEATDALMASLKDDDLEARFATFVALLRVQPQKGADDVKKILDDEQGKMQFIKINEDLKRLEVKIRRGY